MLKKAGRTATVIDAKNESNAVENNALIVSVAETTRETRIAFGRKRLELRHNPSTDNWAVVLYLPPGAQDFPEVLKFGTQAEAKSKFTQLRELLKLAIIY